MKKFKLHIATLAIILSSNIAWAQLNLKLEIKSVPFVSIAETGTENISNRWNSHAFPYSGYSIENFGSLDSVSFFYSGAYLYSNNQPDLRFFILPYSVNGEEGVEFEGSPRLYYQEKSDTVIYEFSVKYKDVESTMNYQILLLKNGQFSFAYDASVIPHDSFNQVASFLAIEVISTDEQVWVLCMGKNPINPTLYTSDEILNLEYYNAAIPSGMYYHFSSKKDGIGNFDALENFHIQKTNNGLRIDVKNGKYVASKMFSMSGQLLAKGESYGSENIFFYLNNEIPKNQPIIISMENENGELHSFKYHF